MSAPLAEHVSDRARHRVLRRLSPLGAVFLCTFLGTFMAGCGTDETPPPKDVEPETPAEPYTLQVFEGVRISSDSSADDFQQATAEVDFQHPPFASVKLVVDLESTCTPFERWQDNPPPEGHNWPADCDAFDRNFEFTLDDPETDGGPPGVELVRAITPFGGPMHLEADITDIANGMPGLHRLRSFIATWPDPEGQVSGANGGWNVTASVVVTPGPAPRPVLAVVPLFNGSQTDPAAQAPLSFQVPEGTRSGRIEYRATGHGGGSPTFGCSGPAEEFCRRGHQITIDDAPVALLDAWRDDCETLCTLAHHDTASGGFDYCQENPCGAIASVRASRANWCPGSETPPFTFEAEVPTTPGAHTFAWNIQDQTTDGVWRLSAHYIAFGP
ncbi:peptide-N-glycosidase F-related protein [Chondromyces apiculatus]|uniref:Peptide-N-glycosidase F C-terminal domain-containing protein n=1 Tax=Chondromyces apiculatus DSM 436 TaxID=1192034 RepID=A0A017T2E3_9BACT|nr:peptide-N-glycosidase F-related protein [Chondromyces apiculatus]EYF03408.1 Hypothetical protein CAP_5601 [Chondromyces apiculatus DSM 436]